MVKIAVNCHDSGGGGVNIVSDEKLIAGLISGGSVRRAAEIAGCSPSTIRQRLKNDKFRKKYDDEKGELLKMATGKLVDTLSTATEVLCSVMNDTSAPPGTRAQAADAVLRHACRYFSISELESRISALEANIDDETI